MTENAIDPCSCIARDVIASRSHAFSAVILIILGEGVAPRDEMMRLPTHLPFYLDLGGFRALPVLLHPGVSIWRYGAENGASEKFVAPSNTFQS